MSRRKVSTTVYLEESQLDMLTELSSVLGMPVAEIVRMGVDIILEREKEHLKIPGQEPDACIWCDHDFGVLHTNKDRRPVRCYPDCVALIRTGWQIANRPIDVGRVMAMAKKRMDDLSCRPPEPKRMPKL
jgi:hypothetical protein